MKAKTQMSTTILNLKAWLPPASVGRRRRKAFNSECEYGLLVRQTLSSASASLATLGLS
jgi:hypothetical protein